MNTKFIQITLAVLIGLGIILLFSQSLWVPKIVEYKLQQENILQYYEQINN